MVLHARRWYCMRGRCMLGAGTACLAAARMAVWPAAAAVPGGGQGAGACAGVACSGQQAWRWSAAMCACVAVLTRLGVPTGTAAGTPAAYLHSCLAPGLRARQLQSAHGPDNAHCSGWHPLVCPWTVPDMQVYRTICALGVPCQLEHSAAGEYSIDVAIPEHRIAGVLLGIWWQSGPNLGCHCIKRTPRVRACQD